MCVDRVFGSWAGTWWGVEARRWHQGVLQQRRFYGLPWTWGAMKRAEAWVTEADGVYPGWAE